MRHLSPNFTGIRPTRIRRPAPPAQGIAIEDLVRELGLFRAMQQLPELRHS